MKRILLLLAFLGLSNLGFANCKITVNLKDWKGGFAKTIEGFDWCFERANSWGLDLSDGWKDRYCSFRTNYDNYGGVTGHDFLFFHVDRTYESRYITSLFYALEADFRNRVFDGYAKTLELNFSGDCKKDDDYPY